MWLSKSCLYDYLNLVTIGVHAMDLIKDKNLGTKNYILGHSCIGKCELKNAELLYIIYCNLKNIMMKSIDRL